jgi:hypothetical protein
VLMDGRTVGRGHERDVLAAARSRDRAGVHLAGGTRSSPGRRSRSTSADAGPRRRSWRRRSWTARRAERASR